MFAKRKKSKAFTLIELLVVISIIAVLLSVLLPALRRAKEQAKKTVCQSNFKQMGYVIAMYASQNRNMIPPGRTGKGGCYWWITEHGLSWGEAVKRSIWQWLCQPYYEALDFQVCPATRETTQAEVNADGWAAFGHRSKTWFDKNTPLPNGQLLQSSYGSNVWMENRTDTDLSFGGRADISTPYQVPLILENCWYEVHCDQSSQPFPNGPVDSVEKSSRGWSGAVGYWIGALYVSQMDRHLGRTQMVFMDGSAKAVGLKSLWQVKWHRRWNKTGYTSPWANPGFSGWKDGKYDWIQKLPQDN